MKVIDIKALTKEHGLRGYSKLKKAELITFLQNNFQPIPAPHTRPPALRTRPPRSIRPPPPPPHMSTWESIDDRPIPAPRPIPTLRPYQLKPKRGKDTFIEPPIKHKELPPSSPKQIKRMKKKLGKLNKKIRHSKRKHNNLIYM